MPWNGLSLAEALNEKPALQLSFYSFGVILRKQDSNGAVCEYPIDPATLARILSGQIQFSTGFLGEDILYYQLQGTEKSLLAYLPPQVHGIWLEASSEPLRLPLPGLILLRRSRDESQAEHWVFAVKERPKDKQAKLYHAPLPNVYNHGQICWGNVAQAHIPADDNSLNAVFRQMLGSPFGNHACQGKSKAEPYDIRKQLLSLSQKKRKQRYPLKDLIPAKTELADLLKG